MNASNEQAAPVEKRRGGGKKKSNASLKRAIDKGLAQVDALLNNVRGQMVDVIKGILRNLVDTRNGVMLDVSDYYEAGFMERIGKYAYCGDYPANFILTRFGLDSRDCIMVEGVDWDYDRSRTFFRDDLDFAEVRAIYGMLLDIESGISCGVMSVDDEGFIRF